MAWDTTGEALISNGKGMLVRAFGELPSLESVTVPQTEPTDDTFVVAAPGWSVQEVDSDTDEVVRTAPVAMWQVRQTHYPPGGKGRYHERPEPEAEPMVRTSAELSPAWETLHVFQPDDLGNFVRLVPPPGSEG